MAALVLLSLSGFATQAMAAGHEGAHGDPERGKSLVIACGSCHGQDGNSVLDPTYAKLAGQNEKYLFNQLKMIQSNERNIVLMTGQLIGKTEQDLRDMAAYYANMDAGVGEAELNETQLERAEEIYRGGVAARGVAACAACHGPRGNGNAFAGFPAIAGQSAPYVVNQLTAYREGERATDEGFGGMMRGVARGLSDGDIKILSQYIQGLY
ncbi:MAG: c-type cytochrome [Pseudomonadota bacterium]